MSEDGRRGWRRHRDTTQIDLGTGSPVARGATATREGPRETMQIDLAGMPRPAPGLPRDTGPIGGVTGGAQVRTVEQHLDEVLSAVRQPAPLELALLDAHGLLCAEDVVSRRAVPAADTAALEGYAARGADLAAATPDEPVQLAVVGDSDPGRGDPGSIGPGMAVRVGAGALLPAGSDVVVPAVWTDHGSARVLVHAALAPGSYVRRAGEDVAEGAQAVQSGTPLGPAQVSLLAAMGRDRVMVRPKPRVSVLCTGPELVDIGTDPAPGQVVDVNSYALAAAARDAGADTYRGGVLPLDRDRLAERLESQTLRSDLIVVSGTAGDAQVREVLAELGEVHFRQVAMHPGPAQGLGLLGRDRVPVVCVPSEPVAALVAFEVFVRPAIRMMLGKRQLFRRTVQAVAAQQLVSPLGYRQYLHGQVMRHPDGGYVVEPVGAGDDAGLARMARGNCLIVVDEDVTEVAEGGLVTVMPMLLGG